ncbi:MAG: FMN-binding protein [Bacteroidales bacterium]|nr:FMN-binding protein [Bacteroidales bacterium]
MKRFFSLALTAMLALGGAQAQQPVHQKDSTRTHQHHHDGPHGRDGHHHHGHHHGQRPVVEVPPTQYNEDGIDMAVVQVFPGVKSVKAAGRWTEVLDKDGRRLGYVVYSKPDSDGIKGYNGETPVLIAFSAKKVITGVYALPNAETPRFAQRVQEAGFYNNWNGLTVKQARKKEVDAVSGATFTSRSVAQSVQAALRKL